jgi:elongator complex protein 3
MRKPTKTISGVTPIAVVIKPQACPHGTCIYCPSLNVPQSYTPKSPAIIRARNLSYSPYKQVLSRIQAFKAMKHPTDKIELIIMGGTFLSYPERYQYGFVLDCYRALNEGVGINTINNSKSQFVSKSKNSNNSKAYLAQSKNMYLTLPQLKKQLEKAKKLNEKAKHRCIALCIETRPDFCSNKEIKKMLEFGCTRVELGVQMPSDRLYKKTKRGHSVKEVIQATERLKNAGFKVGYHIMPGQPFSSIKEDKILFKRLFSDENFRPDQLKIYPCQVIKGSELEKLYFKQSYKPYSEKDLINLVISFKQNIPKYCRIMRIMREIPPEYMVAGTKRIDLRKVISEEMKKQGKKCRCIRCREIGFVIRDKQFPRIDNNLKLNVIEYMASHGKEYFLEIINNQDTIFGLVRLRIPKKSKELLVRELHVYGQALEIGKKEKGKTQHQGLGKELMNEAEKIAKKEKCKKIKVISGVGVREYYKNIDYELDKNKIYMVKNL